MLFSPTSAPDLAAESAATLAWAPPLVDLADLALSNKKNEGPRTLSPKKPPESLREAFRSLRDALAAGDLARADDWLTEPGMNLDFLDPDASEEQGSETLLRQAVGRMDPGATLWLLDRGASPENSEGLLVKLADADWPAGADGEAKALWMARALRACGATDIGSGATGYPQLALFAALDHGREAYAQLIAERNPADACGALAMVLSMVSRQAIETQWTNLPTQLLGLARLAFDAEPSLDLSKLCQEAPEAPIERALRGVIYRIAFSAAPAGEHGHRALIAALSSAPGNLHGRWPGFGDADEVAQLGLSLARATGANARDQGSSMRGEEANLDWERLFGERLMDLIILGAPIAEASQWLRSKKSDPQDGHGAQYEMAGALVERALLMQAASTPVGSPRPERKTTLEQAPAARRL